MPGRSLSLSNYRFGFNGKEKKDDIKNIGDSYDFGARIYDPRLSKWWSSDPEEAKNPNESPYGFVKNNPILRLDYDGKIDFTYNTRMVANGNGTSTKIVDAKVVYRVINLSSRDITGANFTGVQNEVQNKFSYDDNSPSYYKSVSEVKVNVDVQFKVENNFDNIKDGDNVLIIVDELNSPIGKNYAGLANIGGNVAAVEEKHVLNGNFPSLVIHEVGHNMKLDHLDERGNVMNDQLENSNGGRGGLDVNTDQKENIDQTYNLLVREGKGKVEQGNIKSNVQDFVKKNVSKYSGEQSKKINFKKD